MSAEFILEANNNLEELLLSCKTPVLLDFWAEWCQPCLRLVPVIEELGSFAKKEEKPLKIIKLDVDKNPDAVQHYGIRSIPTLILMDEQRKVVDTLRGTMSLTVLLERLQKGLASW